MSREGDCRLAGRGQLEAVLPGQMKRNHWNLFLRNAAAGCLLAAAGCQPPATTSEAYAQTVTFKTAQPAPDAFDAWDFVWKGPKRDANVTLDGVVLQPDGTEYARQDFEAFPGKSENIQSSFSPGFAGGDPKVFYRQPIRFCFRVTKGDLAFAPADQKSFKFRFYKKDARGDVDWRIPFETVEAAPD
jgi:hypothetical protein